MKIILGETAWSNLFIQTMKFFVFSNLDESYDDESYKSLNDTCSNVALKSVLNILFSVFFIEFLLNTSDILKQ